MRTNQTARGVRVKSPTNSPKKVPDAPILGGPEQSPISLLNLDVLKTICDVVEQSPREDSVFNALDGLSRTNHLLRNLTLPSLFRTITIRGEWDTALERVGEMRGCSLLPEYVRTFKFDLFIPDDAEHPPPEQFAPALASLLAKMQKLEKLVLVVPEHHTAIFASEIAKAEFALPAVRTLVVGPFCDFAVQLCPNVTTVSSNGWSGLHTKLGGYSDRAHTRDLIKAAGKAPKVTRLEIMEWWQVDLVEAIHKALPHLTNLALDGGSYKAGIAAFVPVLSRFQDLEYLALANASALGVGFNPPTCGNIYMGCGGKKAREQIDKRRRGAVEKVAKMVAPVCPRLKNLWIGDTTRVEIVRNEDGSFEDFVQSKEEKREQVVYYPRP